MRLRTVTLMAGVVTLQFVPMARAQSFDGAFRGTLVCEKTPATMDMLTAPLDINIRDKSVQFARPLFNLNGTRVIGSELGSGTIDAEGKLHLTSNWYRFGVSVEADYNGSVTKTGGTFSGFKRGVTAGTTVESETAQPLFWLRRKPIKSGHHNLKAIKNNRLQCPILDQRWRQLW